MSLKHLVLIAFVSLICNQGNAQDKNPYIVTGKVYDSETGKPLEYATAALLNPEDSTLINGNTTNSQGKFSVKASQGKYILKLQFLSYKTKYTDPFYLNSKQPEVDFGTLKITPRSKTMDEVTIQGEKSKMIMEMDKKTFNVGKDLSTSGASASDVLDNVPSVVVDQEGNISLRGSGKVKILINGKPSGLVGVSDNQALKQFPANQIEKVEVITNPSSKYQAEGVTGIINIVLKEKRKTGLNGTFNVSSGYPHDHGIGINVNYRKDWFNIFGNYSVNYSRYPGGGSFDRQFKGSDSATIRERDQNRGGIEHTLRFGSEFYMDSSTTLKVSGTFNIGDEDNYTDLLYKDYSATDGSLTHRVLRETHEKEDEGNNELNIIFEKKFNTKKHKLTADFQYRDNLEREASTIKQDTASANESFNPAPFQESLVENLVDAWLGMVDYVRPVGKEGKLETGIRTDLRNIDNRIFLKERQNGNLVSIDQFDRQFDFHEEVHAIYGSYGTKYKNWSFKAGLRTEYTKIITDIVNMESARNERDFIFLFPSAYITYDFTEDKSIQASYSRRINRPNFRDLVPVSAFSDTRNLRKGNPDLNPELTGSYELGYMNHFEDGSFYGAGYYRHTNREIENVTTTNDDGVTVSEPRNLASQDAFGIEINYTKDLKEWWSFDINTNFYRQLISGSYNEQDLSSKATSVQGRVSTDFEVNEWLDFQMNSFYRAPQNEPQGRDQSIWMINAGAGADFWDNKGNLSLSARDLFNTRKWRSITETENFTETSVFQWRRGPSFRLTFTYHLRKKNNQKAKDKRPGDDF